MAKGNVIDLESLLHSPRGSDPRTAVKGDNVTVVTPAGKKLFTATVVSRGQLFTAKYDPDDEGCVRGSEREEYELHSTDQLFSVSHSRSGDTYRVFARVNRKKQVHYVYNQQLEFKVLRDEMGGQPRVSLCRCPFPRFCVSLHTILKSTKTHQLYLCSLRAIVRIIGHFSTLTTRRHLFQHRYLIVQSVCKIIAKAATEKTAHLP